MIARAWGVGVGLRARGCGVRARGCGVKARGWGPARGTHTEIFVINNRKKDKLYKNPLKVLLIQNICTLILSFLV